MPEAIISTLEVRSFTDGRSVEVVANLDAGQVTPGMYIHIPLNSMLDLTLQVADVTRDAEGRLHLFIECADGDADIVRAFNFEDETLWVLESGEA